MRQLITSGRSQGLLYYSRYYTTYQLSQKSNVYNFGVVLWELITGQRPLLQGSKNAHIVQRVRQGLVQGNIEDIVDAKAARPIRRKFCLEMCWYSHEMHVTGIPSVANHGRSVMQLKENLELETPHDRTENVGTSSEYPNMEVSDVSQNSAYVATMSVAGIRPPAR